MKRLISDILGLSNRFYLLSISVRDSISDYYLVELLFKNKELKIENRIHSSDFDAAFQGKLKNNYPVILHIEGDNIINKAVENKIGYRNNVIFNANPNDFHFYEYHKDETVFMSITRKESVETIIKQFRDSNLFVVHLSFGPFVMAHLLPFVKAYKSISSTNYSIQIEDGEILSFKNEKTSQNEYLVNGEALNQSEMPLIASFLDYKYPKETIEFDRVFLNNNRSEFKYKKWFRMAGIFTVAFFLISLFVSHNMLSYYLKKLGEKESQYRISQQANAKVNILEEEKTLKEKILVTSGINSKNFFAKYIADIGNTVPQDITLNDVDIFPVLKKINSSEKIDFDLNTINISGETNNDGSFNTWVTRLQELKWLKKMVIVDYSQKDIGLNSFTIRIKI